MKSLERTLGFREVALIVVGAVIGSGIFIVPATVMRQTGGDVPLALLVWLVAGVLSLLGALAYGELAAMRPEAGGLYVFIREAFGPFPGFLYGWTLFFVIGSGSVAALSAAFTGYLGQLVPVPGLVGKLASIAMIAVAMGVNVRGTRQSARVQNVTTAIKVGALLVMSVLLLGGWLFGAAHPVAAPEPADIALLSGLGLAMVGVLWAYEGWQYATFAAGETIEPQRNFPRGIAVGTLALVLIYCLANIAYVAAIGPGGVMASDSVAASAVGALFGPAAGKLVAVAILISIYSAANALVLTASRVFFAMARDGVFFRQLAQVHTTLGTPAFSIVSMCLWAMVLSASGTFDQLLTYVVFTGWIFYALGAACVFVMRRRAPEAPRPFRVPLYPLTPALFVAAAAAIVLNALFSTPVEAAIGIAVVLAGAPAYMLWRRAAGSPAPASAPGAD
jgi:APA family basic amino acid/polyamine antiporter